MRKMLLPCLMVLSLSMPYNTSAQQGLKGDYYDGDNFQRFVTTKVDAKIDVSWFSRAPVDGIDPQKCSIRWIGRLFAPESGIYTFSTLVDDGVRVWIGNVKVIDAWDLHDSQDFKGDIVLEKGKLYDLKVEYFNALFEGEIHLRWALPSDKNSIWSYFMNSEKIIAPSFFYQVAQQIMPPKPTIVANNQKVSIKKIESSLSKPPVNKPKPVVVTTKSASFFLKPVSADSIQKFIPKNILFEQSKNVMLVESFIELDNLAAFLNRYPALNLTIEGHTDNIGDDQLNLVLSEERAQAVKGYLVQKGIADRRLKAKGFGSSRPLISEVRTGGNLKNRRVEFIIQ